MNVVDEAIRLYAMLLTLHWCMQVNHIPRVKKSALESKYLDSSYQQCWAGLKSHFPGSKESNGKLMH